MFPKTIQLFKKISYIFIKTLKLVESDRPYYIRSICKICLMIGIHAYVYVIAHPN